MYLCSPIIIGGELRTSAATVLIVMLLAEPDG